MAKFSGKTIDKDKFLELYNLGKIDKEISESLNKDISMITYYRKHILQLSKNMPHDLLSLTEIQEQVLIGTLLGDSTLLYITKYNHSPRLRFTHSVIQYEYFLKKREYLNSLFPTKIINIPAKEMYIKGKRTFRKESFQSNSVLAKCLQEYREIFYPNGKKIIPVKYLKNRFTALSLAVLFMDDGNKDGKTINLNLQCFDRENLIEFTDFLETEFNLLFNIKKDKTLYLRQQSYETFHKLVYPYITSDNYYKLPACHH
jgi:hypothetical protein